MKFLFIHNNCPAQFIHIIKELCQKGNEVVFISQYRRDDLQIEGMRHILVPPLNLHAVKFRSETEKVVQETFLTGEVYANIMMDLRHEGFIPDAVCAHPGWGASIYVPDIFPNAAYIIYCEWFYTKGEHFLFFAPDQNDPRIFASNRQRNLCQLEALRACDAAISPTSWQASQYPIEYAPKINVIHDGINMDFFAPATPDGQDSIVQGLDLSEFTEIVTYATRGLEPYRGFPQFFRSIPQILKTRPQCHIVIMANDEVRYSAQRADGKTWGEVMREEVPYDTDRVHFLNFGSYEEYVKLLRASTVHVYLTVPFVLSWSMLEAMSCGCIVVASETSPVREIIKHSHNGFLTSFWNSKQISKTIVNILKNAPKCDEIINNARKTIAERYDIKQLVPIHLRIIRDAIKNKKVYVQPKTKSK